jgi:hypothetical protein
MIRKCTCFIAIATQFVFSTEDFAQAPILGTSSTFSLFTATGAIDILGTSTVYGDVGTNIGAFSISAPSIIFGVIHNTDATSLSAAADVASAYSDVDGRTCGFAISGSTSLGTTRKILGPDTVFCLAGAQALDSNLTLDAKGDPSAIFIIQIDGALTTNTSSAIILINSASFCNVYWQVNGAVTIGINSVFNGTIIANGAISLLNNAIVNGRMLSQAGALALNNNILTGCDGAGVPLPLKLMSFTCKYLNSKVHLQWTTATECTNDFFTVQRSQDGVIVEDIMHISGTANSGLSHQFSAIDDHPLAGKALYRLKQTDDNGTSTYSNYISLSSSSAFQIKIFPNPFSSSIFINLPNGSEHKNCVLRIYTTTGQQLVEIPINNVSTTVATDHFVAGIYHYTITADHEIIDQGPITCID